MFPRRRGLTQVLTALLLAGLWCTPQTWAAPKPKRVDISKVEELLRVYRDGQGHYVIAVIAPKERFKEVTRYFFYGDGKVFYRQRAPSASRNGERFGVGVFDPRVTFLARSHFSYTEDEGTLRCEDRKTRFTALGAAKTRALLKKAKLYDIYWRRTSHALARDDEGRYYFVDRLRSVDESFTGYRGYRLFVGVRGKMKRQKLKDAINDPAGELFITNAGKLRLVADPKHPLTKKTIKAFWITGKGKKKSKEELTVIPANSLKTRITIYRHLGVYQGQRLHKPCDDL
jgi:hypothetical protein